MFKRISELEPPYITQLISTSIPLLLLFICPITVVYSIALYTISMVEEMKIGQPEAVAISVGLVRTFSLWSRICEKEENL